MVREATIENRLVREVEKRGGLCLKFTSPSNPGVPDRIVIMPDGRVIFVELKQEYGRLASLQKWQIERMRERHQDVRVLRGMDKVQEFIKEIFSEKGA